MALSTSKFSVKHLLNHGANAGSLVAFVLVLGVTFLTSCNKIGSGIDAVNHATSVIDDGIARLTHNSEDWQAILQDVSDKLPKELNESIRTDVSNLVQRSTANVGVEFRANTDFLAGRVSQELQRIKAELLGKPAPSLPPMFAQVIPDALDLTPAPASRTKVELCGWDFDQKDSKGDLFKAFLVSRTGSEYPLTEDRIGRSTHYSVVLNVSGDVFVRQMSTNGVSKIVLRWDGKPLPGSGEILVIPRQAATKTLTRMSLGTKTYQPPHVAYPGHAIGDADFDVNGGRFMSIYVKAELRLFNGRIQRRVTMRAREEHDDWTAAEGVCEWEDAYVPPTGWKIQSVSLPGPSVYSFNNTTTSEEPIKFPMGGGTAAWQFLIWGSHNNDSAGTFTRVEADFNSVDIVLVEVL